MSWESRALRRIWPWTLAAVAILLAACTTTTTTSTNGGPPTAASLSSSDSKDHSTSSDEEDVAKRARVRMELASGYFSRGQMKTALAEVKRAIEVDPTLAAAFNLRGLIHASMGDNKLAEESFRHALQLDARDADTMQNFGWYLCQQRRYDEADAQFRQALAVPQYRDVPRTLLTQGVCQARAGKWAQAESTLAHSYELDSANPVTAVNLSQVLYHQGEFQRARFYIRRVNSNPDVSNAQTLWLAARIEHRMANAQGTRDLGAQLRSRFPQSPEALKFEQGKFDG
jgi:type IV pilus assembly protein PilF